jgi:hypothetical protein
VTACVHVPDQAGEHWELRAEFGTMTGDLYKDEHGARRDARADFATVTGAPRERAGADGPFGVFNAFLPPAGLGYGANHDPPAEEHPRDPDAIEVIAYTAKARP